MIIFSIVIPTYNRPSYLRRLLSYYEAYNIGFNIFVADSSSIVNKAKNREIVSLFPNMDILYIEDYPPEINPFIKFSDALSHVTTPYCAFCADDDFITPAGIEESVEFLENNRDFSAAHGHNLTFFIEDDKENKQQFRWISPYSTESILHTDASARLEYHLSNYSLTTFYAVHRTELLKTAYKQTLESKTDLILFGELLLSVLTIIYGKLKCLDIFYAARDGTSIAAAEYIPSIVKAIEAGTYDDEYAKFRDC